MVLKVDSPSQELEKHRYAMKKMADDILKLRNEATRLQARIFFYAAYMEKNEAAVSLTTWQTF
jgi:hypothetical protein